MNPNDNDPNATPPVDGANSVPVTPEAPTTPIASEAPASPDPVTPITPETPVTPGAPVVPLTPSTPDTTSPFTAGVPAAGPEGPKTPKFSKKMILIAAVVGGAILLAIIAAIIFVALTSVSKEDYRDAVRQYNKVNVASASLTSDVSLLGSAAGNSSDAIFDQRVSEVEDSIAKIKTENAELAKLKAVRVGEGAKLYKTFNDKMKAYLAYGSDLVTSVKNLRPAMVTCDNVSDASDAAARVAAVKACATELEGISDIPNEQMKTYITALADSYKKYASIYEQMTALTNPYGAQYEQYKALRDQSYDVQDAITAAGTTFRKDLEKQDDELSVKDSANKLGDYLSDQQKS